MKIVVIETRRDHYETLGYFFYLKHRMPNIKVVIYAHDPDNTWLKFFNKEIASLDILNIDEISKGAEMTPLEGDIAFINSIDVPWDATGKESIDYHVNYVARSNNFDRVYLQLHMGNNENANKFRNLDVLTYL